MHYGARMAIGLLTTAVAVAGCTKAEEQGGDGAARGTPAAADAPARVQVSADTQQLSDSSRMVPVAPDSTG